jgi:hypothetical protein
MILTRVICIAVTFCCALGGNLALGQDGNTRKKGVFIEPLGDVLRVMIDGEFFTDYHYRNVPRPFFYPVLGPGGLPMTRNWPMKDAENEEHDHKHHRSLWFTHGDVNGVDFWSEEPKAGKIVHEKFIETKSGQTGVIKSTDQWVAPDGKIVCTDERTLRVYSPPTGRLFDFEVTIQASNGDLTFGDTKEGTMAIRLAETMRLKGNVGHGHIVNSEGVRDGETWGRHAAWVDYHGPVQGQTVGVAIFDHPGNPRHPTTWHVRDYGLFAANPFGLHDFENKAPSTGNLKVPAGESVTFRYRFYMHAGDEKEGKVAENYKEYIASGQKK